MKVVTLKVPMIMGTRRTKSAYRLLALASGATLPPHHACGHAHHDDGDAYRQQEKLIDKPKLLPQVNVNPKFQPAA